MDLRLPKLESASDRIGLGILEFSLGAMATVGGDLLVSDAPDHLHSVLDFVQAAGGTALMLGGAVAALDGAIRLGRNWLGMNKEQDHPSEA